MIKTGRRLPRFRRERDAVQSFEITPRDKEIIRQVARFRFLRSSHIIRLVEGARAQLLRRLQVLYHHGYLERPRCQIDYFHRVGSRPMAYCLGSRGASLLRREFDTPFSGMVWSKDGKEVGRYFLDHALMVSEVLIGLELACRSDGCVRFIPQDELTSENRKPIQWSATLQGRRVGLIPDAVFALDFRDTPDADSRVLCCLEADRGTMPVTRKSTHLSSISRKLESYAQLWKRHAFVKRFGTKRLHILTVTTGVDRAENIRKAVAELPHGKGLFSTWTEQEVQEDAAQIIRHLAGARRDKEADF